MGNRKFKSIFKEENGEVVISESKESINKMSKYKEAINMCCMPGCESGKNLETHHINPCKKGGEDKFYNYIVLCHKCHRTSRIHSRSEEKRFELYYYKIYVEDDKLGFDSSQLDEEEFLSNINNFLRKTEEKREKSKEQLAKEMARKLSRISHSYSDKDGEEEE